VLLNSKLLGIVSTMAKKEIKTHASKTQQGVTKVDSLDQSQFYLRLQSFTTQDAKQLQLDVLTVVNSAKSIATYVVRFLPQFTDHAEQHFFNVLSYMEFLAGPANIKEMGPLECGLAILAAFTHDLGMALSAEELNAMQNGGAQNDPKSTAWRAYRDSHSLNDRIRSLDRTLERDQRAQTGDEAMWRDGVLAQIRADYIRESHADETVTGGYNRISDWLDKLTESKELHVKYRGFQFWTPLAWLGMSHGQSIYWLSNRLQTGSNGFRLTTDDVGQHEIAHDESINWHFLGWLLRLADILDLDASRTPQVLFDHAGISNDISRREWQKHLSIASLPKVHSEDGTVVLRYICHECPSPGVEKAIHQTLSCINNEIAKVRTAQAQSNRERLNITLPARAEIKIGTRRGNYLYRDVEFRLDRESIMELLMGVSLYGEPTLAVRELVQNALDALHMREMRNRLRQKLHDAGLHANLMPEAGEPIPRDNLCVSVTWGTTVGGEFDGRRFIRVHDNGVGMRIGTIQRFLTRIGRSYYKSDNFRRERDLMHEHELICTTISQFGIGFLSCFMLADHVTVRTRAAGASINAMPGPSATESEFETSNFPVRAEINGPHGLIAFYPDPSVEECGTEVTLWLKSSFQLPTFEKTKLIERAHRKFYQQSEGLISYPADAVPITPADAIAEWIVWPIYPVRCQGGNSAESLEIDESFHRKFLHPIDGANLQDIANEWRLIHQVANLPSKWATIDWTDLGPLGSGSRIRIIVPFGTSCFSAYSIQEFSELLSTNSAAKQQLIHQAWVEPQLPAHARTVVLVNGVRVKDLDHVLGNQLSFGHGVGTFLWIDLRGSAAPSLKADRERALTDQTREVLATVATLQQQIGRAHV
jgi:hypothetical protein